MKDKKKKQEPEVIVTSDVSQRRPGDIVVCITDQAEGALPNGTRIVKQNTERGDNHQNGAEGKILGSVRDGDIIAYFIEWDDMPGVPLGTLHYKIRKVD